MNNRIPKHAANGHACRTGKSCNGPSTAVSDGDHADAKPATQPSAKPVPKPPAQSVPKPSDAQPAADAGRTASGQFAPGNKCSLGNPFARRLGALRSAFLNAVTDADVATVARKLAALAALGDVQAAALFLSYAVGKPAAVVNPDRLALEEFALLDAAPTKARMLTAMIDAIDPAAAAEIVRRVMPSSPDRFAEASAADKRRLTQAIQAEADARIGKPLG
jgi:hypothetical protein